MRIGKKTIHSVIIGLAMALPILYLFGTMIAGLAGAHGNSPFESDTPIKLYDKEVNFNQLAGRDSYNEVSDSLTININEGNYTAYCVNKSGSYFSTLAGVNLTAGHTFAVCTYSTGTPQSSTVWQLYVQNPSNTRYLVDTYTIFDVPSNVSSYVIRLGIGVYGGASIDVGFVFNVFDLTAMFPESPTIESLQEYYQPSFAYPYAINRVDTFPVYGVPDVSQYYFSQFFPRDNFVSLIGKNALSENPKGFAPFGTMLSYLDSTVFHAGDTQTALMVYGMVYWSLHVILADLVYHVLVFVPNLINRVFDWFGQKGVSDD